VTSCPLPELPALLRPAADAVRDVCAPLPDWRLLPPERQQALLHAATFSPWLAQCLLHDPGPLLDAAQPGWRGHLFTPATDGDEGAFMAALRRARRAEMARIALGDLAGWNTLDATLTALTSLAENALTTAHAWLWPRSLAQHGAPRAKDGSEQTLVVLGMGKLGGGELNFSSDIDLIYAYPQDGQCDGARALDNSEFFLRHCRKLSALLAERTADGFVFRVDTRLRPFGAAGALALSADAMEDYYQTHGREWERYALIKARPVAGDTAAGETLLSRLQPFIYRRYLDFGVLESLRELKSMIEAEVARRDLRDNVKLGPGGIREIEFIAQALQLARGGQEPALRQRATRPVLATLASLGLLPSEAALELTRDYEYLRRLENRIQMQEDAQTHVLPTDDAARQRLALSMGHADWDDLLSEINACRARVQARFELLLARPRAATAPEPATAATAFADAEVVAVQLAAFNDSSAVRAMSAEARVRLDRLLPSLVATAATAEGDAHETLQRLLRLAEAVARRSAYLALLNEHPQALDLLARLMAASPWIAAHLTRHPVLLDELLDARVLLAPLDQPGLAQQLTARLSRLPPDDLEAQMEALRLFKHAQVLRIAAADILGVLPLMRVSDHLTALAEVLLQAVHDLAFAALSARHGRPQGGLAVIGYGKLGSWELGYGSDLDLVFLHNAGEGETAGAHPVENAVFFARLAQRIIHLLSTQTASGALYETDTRLRPSGRAGLLVSSLAAFAQYQQSEAWTWEHQALIRARPVAGDAGTAAVFENVRAGVLTHPRDPATLRAEVCAMRQKMRAELDKPAPGQFHLKQGPGGLVDLEFLMQYLTLLHAPVLASWRHPRSNARLLETALASGVLPETEVRALATAWRALRGRQHRLKLAGGGAHIADTELAAERRLIHAAWRAQLHCAETAA
jgi:glutamate-ammonia-ligase adenylyltransferase